MNRDPLTHQERRIALPGLCARVILPMPANFLQTPEGGNLAIGELHETDAVLLGLAVARQYVAHWRGKWLAREGMSNREAEVVPMATLVHAGIVDKLARDFHDATGDQPWCELEPADQAAARARVGTIVTLFLEEIARG